MKSRAVLFCFFLVAGGAAFCCLATQGQQDSGDAGPRTIIRTDRGIFTTRANPITLPLPAEDDSFQFVIYGDRTGGVPEGVRVLEQAVIDTNLIAPDFVITVGDLIQGYNRPKAWMVEMEEFRGVMGRLKMDWFPVAGNHDVYWDFRDLARPKGHHEANYETHFGPLWYSFTHKNTGFIVLYSDEGDAETGEKGFNEARLQNVSPEQMEFLDQALERFKDRRQVFVFLHHPRWLGGGYEGSNWPVVHGKLVEAGNVTGVFAGHIHHMTFLGPVDGIEYYTLATTGGHLAMDSPEIGHLHHFNIVTVRNDEFTVASVPVGAVMDPKNFKAEFLADVELVRAMRPERSKGKVELNIDGSVRDEYSVQIPNPGTCPIEVTVVPRLSGTWKALPDHEHILIPPGKSAGMNFWLYRGTDSTSDPWQSFAVPKLGMSVEYLHSSARVRLPEVFVDVELALSAADDEMFADDIDKCLKLRGRQTSTNRQPLRDIVNDSLRINSAEIELAQGPFTLEAWVNPSHLDLSRAVVAKTESSEYALFLHDGRATFDVHLNGRYVSPQSKVPLPKNQWSHLAGVYDGRQVRLYINGKLVEALDGSGNRTTNNLPLFVGADPDEFGNPNREFGGLIDEVRLSQGARYEAEFEPEERFERDAETLLLLHLDREIGPFVLDDSGRKVTVTKNGRAAIVQ